MSNGKIKISELPETAIAKDSDIFILENDTTTQKISLGSVINYIKEHEEIAEYFIKQTDIDSKNGVAPLDNNRKIPYSNLPFGTTENTIFDGAQGKSLSDTLSSHLSDKSNPHAVTKKQIGLSDVDNTADISKPVSTAQQKAIDAAYANANAYTDTKIAELTDNLPSGGGNSDLSKLEEAIAKIPLYGKDFSNELIQINNNYHIYLTDLNNGLVQLQLQASNVTLSTSSSTSIAFLPSSKIFFNTFICVPYFVSTGAGMQFCVLSVGSTTYNGQYGTLFGISGLKDSVIENISINFRTLIK